jgi:hypothetical protein
MSIIDEIRSLTDAGVLTHLLPIEPRRSVERDVFVSSEVWDFLQGNNSDPKFSAVGLRSYRRLESFICGDLLVFGMDPSRKKSTSLVARNDDVKQGVVDVRVNDPQPAVRIFGCFAKKDVLVLLRWRSRADLQSKGFASSIRACQGDWQTLFPNYRPHYSEDPNDYISGLVDFS